MLRGRVADLVSVSVLAAIVTAAMAAPVLLAPSERLFGMEIVGRHHDPFTVMEQFERPVGLGVYSQPITDIPGHLLARISGAVAAYNWLVLMTFPLSAAAAYLLARHLALSPVASAVAAMAFAFSPFHIAHAAYHPHVAQTQWLPLYLLALWRCLDRASPAAIGFLVAAAAGVTLSNFYGGLIAAVITPVAIAAYWFVSRPAGTRSTRRLAVTVGSLVVIATAGIAYASYAAGTVVADRGAFAFPRADLFRYGAKWWSYLVPPVVHPILGEAAQRVWTAVGVSVGLLEQQVSLGWGVVALGLIAILRWTPGGRSRQPGSLVYVPVLVIVATAAFVCSLSPQRAIGSLTAGPSAILYGVVPMFRSYARFGVVVQLMAALLAGIGVDRLLRADTARARVACALLVILIGGEYMVWPPDAWRDVLPTSAHRWVLRQPGRLQVLDCAPPTVDAARVQALTASRIVPRAGTVADCLEPDLPHKLAATGYTHVVVRRDTSERRWFASRPAPDGLRRQVSLRDGDVFAVAVDAPPVYTAAMAAFFEREHDRAWTWRWMGTDATWTIVNTTTRPVAAILHLELLAFHRSRRLELHLDGQVLKAFVVEPRRRVYALGPITIAPGDHELAFHPADPPLVADGVIDNGDRRRLSFAVGTWTWTVDGDRP
jgi:hypothetical protein